MQGRYRTRDDRKSVALTFIGDKVYTKQSFKDECDINILMASYKATGVLNHLAQGLPSFGDFSSSVTYHEASMAILDAQAAFDQLPSEIRTKMNNDPHQLLQFLEDPANREEATQMGLFDPPPENHIVSPPPENRGLSE